MMPDMRTTLHGFEETMQFQIVNKAITDHDLVETSGAPVVLWFEGSLQSMHPRDLLVKKEGERNWRWFTLFTDMRLDNDSVIVDRDGAQYRVMATDDWSQAGYYKYQLIEGTGINQ